MAVSYPEMISGVPSASGYKTPSLKNVQQLQNGKIMTYEAEAKTGKKWGVGLASFFMPGAGQAINNQWGKAIAFYLGTGLLPTICAMPLLGALVEGAKNNKMPKIGMGVASMALCVGTALGGKIWSAVDAVKNSKTVITQYVPNTQNQTVDINV